MSTMKKNLGELLNTALQEKSSDIEDENADKIISPKKEIVSTGDEKDLDEDYKLARQELHNLITQSGTAIDSLIALASDAESPRAYEVLGQLIKTNTELVKELLENYKRMNDLKSDNNKSPQNITNNTFFTGSSKDLLELLKDIKENETIIDIKSEKNEPTSS